MLSVHTYQAFKFLFFLSRVCSLMSRYLEKLLTDVCENWRIVEAIQGEEVGLKLLVLFSYL